MRAALRWLDRIAAAPLIGFVHAWRFAISPLYGQVCRYYPSCSAYGLDALRTHGAVIGVWLTVRRLIRCHPWSAGGYDPVPSISNSTGGH